MNLFSKKTEGFTLIELLVVIAIIGMLASIVLVALGPARERGRDAKRQSDIRQVSTAMELCYDDADCGGGKEKYVSSTGGANNLTNIDSDSTPCYLCAVPVDPTNSGSLQYTWISNSANTTLYCVYALLEGPSTSTYIAASHKGTKFDLAAAPTTSACW